MTSNTRKQTLRGLRIKQKTKRVVVPEGVKQRDLDAPLRKLRRSYCLDVMIGIDPGVRLLCTAACVGHLPTRRERRHRNRRKISERKGHLCVEGSGL
jgi:hypothetical protein